MTVGIDDTAVINNIIMTDQSSAPATPGAGKTRIFTEANGLYVVDDDGLTIGPFIPADGWIPSKLTWTWNSSDDPSYVIETNSNVTGTFSAGMRFKITDSSEKMFIVTKVAFSGSNTQLTMYGGTDYDLTSGTLTSPYYSTMKAPYNFPLNSTKWTVEFSSASNASQASPTQNQWYNLTGTVSVPIGAWKISYFASVGSDDSSVTTLSVNKVTLSTANNSESDSDLSSYITQSGALGNLAMAVSVYREKYLSVSSKTTYYLNIMTSLASASNIYLLGGNSKTIIRVISAYL